jgi:hypothetical protein
MGVTIEIENSIEIQRKFSGTLKYYCLIEFNLLRIGMHNSRSFKFGNALLYAL